MPQNLSADAVLEAALLTSPVPVGLDKLSNLFNGMIAEEKLLAELKTLEDKWQTRGLRLVQVASGYRFQSAPETAPYLARLYEERPPRYSRAAMETLAVIVYRQPVTRGDIEDIRGVKINPEIIRTFTERGWIEVVGRRQTPGRPELFGTTKQFLEDLGLQSLSDLPSSVQSEDGEVFELGIPMPPSVDSGSPEAAAGQGNLFSNLSVEDKKEDDEK